MSQVVWKYTLDAAERQILEMPKGAQILSVQVQHEQIAIWVLLDPAVREKEERLFHVHGTGYKLPDVPLKFLGTVLAQQGYLVLHIFEETQRTINPWRDGYTTQKD